MLPGPLIIITAMAKSKKKKNQVQAPLSSDTYMRRVMRSLPVDKCYVNADWAEQGMAHVVIVRRRPDGKFAMAVYLVDTYCLGVKDAFWRTSIEKLELDAMIKNFEDRIAVKECDYATAHNLILGAIEFAEEGGIKPCKEWNLGQYGLNEDTDDIPLIEFDYGLNGVHFLNTYTRSEGAKYIPLLEANLGDNFYCRFEEEEEDKLPEEEYLAPEGVVYPTELNLKHPEIAEILCDKENLMVVPVEQMARIAAIDRDELIDDLAQLTMYELGLDADRLPARDEEPDEAAVFHSVAILNSLADSRGLDTILAILRMHPDTLDYYFGDTAPRVFSSAISNCCKGRYDDLEAFLNEPGRGWYSRSMVLDALEILRQKGDDSVNEIVRRQLESLPERVPELTSADGQYSGFVCTQAMKTGDRTMLPLIKVLYDNDLIEEQVCGDYEDVEKDFGNFSERKPMTMSNIYCWTKHFNEPYGDDFERYNEPDYDYLWVKEAKE